MKRSTSSRSLVPLATPLTRGRSFYHLSPPQLHHATVLSRDSPGGNLSSSSSDNLSTSTSSIPSSPKQPVAVTKGSSNPLVQVFHDTLQRLYKLVGWVQFSAKGLRKKFRRTFPRGLPRSASTESLLTNSRADVPESKPRPSILRFQADNARCDISVKKSVRFLGYANKVTFQHEDWIEGEDTVTAPYIGLENAPQTTESLRAPHHWSRIFFIPEKLGANVDYVEDDDDDWN